MHLRSAKCFGRPSPDNDEIQHRSESDFSGPYIIGYGSSPSRCGPAAAAPFRSDPRSPSFRCDPFARDVALDPGKASAPRNDGAAHVAFERMKTLGPCDINLSRLNPTPHAIAVYASQPLSPAVAQHSLPSGRYPLLGPDFHRLERTSLRLAHSFDDLVSAGEERRGHVDPDAVRVSSPFTKFGSSRGFRGGKVCSRPP